MARTPKQHQRGFFLADWVGALFSGSWFEIGFRLSVITLAIFFGYPTWLAWKEAREVQSVLRAATQQFGEDDSEREMERKVRESLGRLPGKRTYLIEDARFEFDGRGRKAEVTIDYGRPVHLFDAMGGKARLEYDFRLTPETGWGEIIKGGT